MCCQLKHQQKREPSLLIDRSATAREAETTIQTFWSKLTKSTGKYIYIFLGLLTFHFLAPHEI